MRSGYLSSAKFDDSVKPEPTVQVDSVGSDLVRLEDAVAILNSRLTSLGDRLLPVMKDAPPQAVKSAEANSVNRSPISRNVDSVISKVVVCAEYINDLLRDLDL